MFKAFRDFLLDVLFPPHCVACKREGNFFCIGCLRQLKFSPSLLHRPESSDTNAALKGLFYVFKYSANPSLQMAIKQFKYRFNMAMADYFAALILKKGSALPFFTQRPLFLIPVPLHRKRLYWRGFNQAKVLADALHRLMPMPVCEGLKRVKATEQQALLSRQERLNNLKDSFMVLPDLQGIDPETTLILVDDVYTTGTTLNECAETLRRAGFKKVYGLVIAKA